MKRTLVLLALGCLAALGCRDQNMEVGEGSATEANPEGIQPAPTKELAHLKQPDEQVGEKVKHALASDDRGSKLLTHMRVDLKDGTVYLRGNLATEAQKQHVEAIARKAAGEVPVENQIKVTSPSATPPPAIPQQP